MSPSSPQADILTSNLLIDPRWSGIGQFYNSTQDFIDAERRLLSHNDAGIIYLFYWNLSLQP